MSRFNQPTAKIVICGYAGDTNQPNQLGKRGFKASHTYQDETPRVTIGIDSYNYQHTHQTVQVIELSSNTTDYQANRASFRGACTALYFNHPEHNNNEAQKLLETGLTSVIQVDQKIDNKTQITLYSAGKEPVIEFIDGDHTAVITHLKNRVSEIASIYLSSQPAVALPAAELSAKRDRLIKQLERALETKSDLTQIFNALSTQPVESWSPEQLKRLFSLKGKLTTQLKAYLNTPTHDLKAISTPNTVLGALTDHQRSRIFKTKITATRTHIDNLIAEKEAKQLQAAAQQPTTPIIHPVDAEPVDVKVNADNGAVMGLEVPETNAETAIAQGTPVAIDFAVKPTPKKTDHRTIMQRLFGKEPVAIAPKQTAVEISTKDLKSKTPTPTLTLIIRQLKSAKTQAERFSAFDKLTTTSAWDKKEMAALAELKGYTIIRDALHAYLNQADRDLTQSCNPQNAFGALIDQHRSVFGHGVTETRKLVQKIENTPRVALDYDPKAVVIATVAEPKKEVKQPASRTMASLFGPRSVGLFSQHPPVPAARAAKEKEINIAALHVPTHEPKPALAEEEPSKSSIGPLGA